MWVVATGYHTIERSLLMTRDKERDGRKMGGGGGGGAVGQEEGENGRRGDMWWQISQARRAVH